MGKNVFHTVAMCAVCMFVSGCLQWLLVCFVCGVGKTLLLLVESVYNHSTPKLHHCYVHSDHI